MTDSRFVNVNADVAVSNLTSYSHPSLESMGSNISKHIIFYRGPLPVTNTRPDNVYAYYATTKYKSQRVLQPTLSGSL